MTRARHRIPRRGVRRLPDGTIRFVGRVGTRVGVPGLPDAGLDRDGRDGRDAAGPATWEERRPPVARPASRRGRLVELTAGGAGQPLFVVHAVGGTVYAYAHLAARFVADASRTLGLDAAAALDSRPGTDHLAWLAERMDAGAGNRERVRAEIERRFEVFEANSRAIAGYRPAGALRTAALS